jgi:hypothetical protein
VARGERQPAQRLRLPIDVHAHEPETIYVVPITSDSEHYPPEASCASTAAAAAATSGSRSPTASRSATAT